MNFKEMVKEDLDIFLNLEEFAEPHSIEGRDNIPAIFDEESMIDLQFKLGVIEGEKILLIAKTADLPEKRGAGASLSVDHIDYKVVDWIETQGISTISLTRGII